MQTEYLGGAQKIIGANLKMIPNYIYFYHLDKFCVLPLYPESLQDTMGTSFAETDALSRSAPVFSYTKSGPRQVSVNFTVHRDLMNDLNRGVSNLKANTIDFNGEDYVDTLIKYLQSVALPRYREYKNGMLGPSRPCPSCMALMRELGIKKICYTTYIKKRGNRYVARMYDLS